MYESMADSSDMKYGTGNIRKSILKFAEGVYLANSRKCSKLELGQAEIWITILKE